MASSEFHAQVLSISLLGRLIGSSLACLGFGNQNELAEAESCPALVPRPSTTIVGMAGRAAPGPAPKYNHCWGGWSRLGPAGEPRAQVELLLGQFVALALAALAGPSPEYNNPCGGWPGLGLAGVGSRAQEQLSTGWPAEPRVGRSRAPRPNFNHCWRALPLPPACSRAHPRPRTAKESD